MPGRAMITCTDGLTVHLLFSGDDCFSVRKATLVLHPQPRTAGWESAVPPVGNRHDGSQLGCGAGLAHHLLLAD
jgi:hypothetical protein